MLRRINEVFGVALRCAALLLGMVMAFVYVPQLAMPAAERVTPEAAAAFSQTDFITIILTAVTVVLAALGIILALAGAVGYVTIWNRAEAVVRTTAADVAARVVRETAAAVGARSAERTANVTGGDRGSGDELARAAGDDDGG